MGPWRWASLGGSHIGHFLLPWRGYEERMKNKRLTLTVVAPALIFAGMASPAAAQSQQEQLDARYDRALAAGYKALFLCSAIFNAERNGATRTPESVEKWELTGIRSPIDEIVEG